MTKDDLKEIIGLGSSARLYSQLQRDRAKVNTGSDITQFTPHSPTCCSCDVNIDDG